MTTKSTPTPKHLQNFLTKLAAGDFIATLYTRWQDEKGHESIADYGLAVSKVKGIKEVVACTKRPFGFHVRLEEFPDAVYSITRSSRDASWDRIG